MITLGIHDGHTATACLMEDGRVVACLSEERLNRVKEWSGFPVSAIMRCLEIAGKSPAEVDAVGVCSHLPQIGEEYYFKPNRYKRAFSYLVKVLPTAALQNPRNIGTIQSIGRFVFKERKRLIRERLSEMGFPTARVFFFEHHLSHAATTYYSNWHRPEKTLVLTLDGSGDAVCATVNIGAGGRLERLAQVFNYNSVCDFYTRVTQFLGMKPMSHEYKVMGMAPYASERERGKISDLFQTYFKSSEKNPLLFCNTKRLYKWQFLKELNGSMQGQRFDWIAGGVQDFFEQFALGWVQRTLAATGVGDVALSGGGFMNVKLNYLISRLPEVRSLFIFPSCGDESNPIGASILASLEAGYPADQIARLDSIYWGPKYPMTQILAAVDRDLRNSGFRVSEEQDVNGVLCRKLLEGKIIGRYTGRMEWGARALGNRSILADPRNQKIIHKINKAIKMRDFWMPFAPSILDTHRDIYLDLRPDFRSPFMTIACDTKPRAWDDIPAGLHPFDKSSRAQILDARSHGSYYDLVSRFEKETGVGGVLNTSFNLHGEPIVCSPQDAVDTFLKSDLDVLQLENLVIEKT